MKIIVLTKYGRSGASSRLRSFQYFSWLSGEDFKVTLQPLFTDDILDYRYKYGVYKVSMLLKAYYCRFVFLLRCKRFDVVWIEKEALPWCPLWLELLLLQDSRYVLDYDDAIFHNYDQHRKALVRYFFGKRIDGLMAKAKLVIGGNEYLAKRACDAGASWVEVVPTVIDLDRYPVQKKMASQLPVDAFIPRIVWIGSPSTKKYLQIIKEPLQKLAMLQPFVLRVIGGGEVDLPGVQVEVVKWTEKTEVERIRECHIGVMPLFDSLWELGKCGYKIIQYMACELPVVASYVGVNSEIVNDGINGFLAKTSEDWLASLSQLLNSPELRAQMGNAGRRLVEEKYCIQETGPVIANLLRRVRKK